LEAAPKSQLALPTGLPISLPQIAHCFARTVSAFGKPLTPKRKRAHFDAGTLIGNPRLPANSALKAAVDAWFDEAKKARWSSAADVKRSYATASIVSADRIVFNIKGNDYRLVIATDFDKGIGWIKWIGTHKDYDKIDVKEAQHGG
jgi:mRNA interferase HigB